MLEVENFVTLVLVNKPFFQDEDYQNRFHAITFWWKIEQIIQDCCDIFMFFSIGEFFHIFLLILFLFCDILTFLREIAILHFFRDFVVLFKAQLWLISKPRRNC